MNPQTKNTLLEKFIERDFPNLKIKNMLEIGTYNPLNECCFIQDIQEHCLDKQKVKEAIDKVFDMSDEEDAVHNLMIKNELGL